jgi:hypothetical protein
MSFSFATPKIANLEIAIVQVDGSTRASEVSDNTLKKRYKQMMDGNRECIAKAVLQHLQIPSEVWSDSVEPRPLHIADAPRPWEVTICALVGTATTTYHHLFGSDLTKTHAMCLSVDVYKDVKARTFTSITLELEVGAAGMYNYFRQLGGKGLRVLPEGSQETGTILITTLNQNVKSWPYQDQDWQAASNHYMLQYITVALKHGAPENATITVEHFATQAMLPLNSLTERQTAFGVKHFYLVKGITFTKQEDDEADGFGTVPCPMIILKAPLLDGTVSEDGTSPGTTLTKFRIGVRGIQPKLGHGGEWWPPAAVEAEALHRAGGAFPVAGPAGGWANAKTQRRRAHSKAAAVRHREEKEEEGATSDSGSVSSKLARTGLHGRAPSPGMSEAGPSMY